MANNIPIAPFASPEVKFIGAVQDGTKHRNVILPRPNDDPEDYSIGAPIGFGASSIVYAAVFSPKGGCSNSTPCAIKVIDLDHLPQSALHLLTRETRLMSLSKHPNVLRIRGTWMTSHKIFIALRLMRKGSVRDVMRYNHVDGLEEEVIKCILAQALHGLHYLHVNGFIHRDIKAANLLVDDDGTVLLGDLGVAVSLSEEPNVPHPPTQSYSLSSSAPDSTRPPASSPRLSRRKSFVGTPCWMAPEVVAQKSGYNASADIYSLGITALELAHGRAPHSLDPPHKALMKTLQNASPTLDRVGRANKYSRAFKEVIDSCLRKDPSLRPTAADLLTLPFFKSAKRKDYLVGALLTGLPPLTARQERRKHATLLTSISTHSSWDFTQSILIPPSPSHHSRLALSRPNSLHPTLVLSPLDIEEFQIREHSLESLAPGLVTSDQSRLEEDPQNDVANSPGLPIATTSSPSKPIVPLSIPLPPHKGSDNLVEKSALQQSPNSPPSGKWRKFTDRINSKIPHLLIP